MSLIAELSEECSTSPLEWFQIKPTHTAIEKSADVEFNSLTSVREGAALEFYVPASTEEYVDLENTKLYVKCKIVRANGGTLENGDIVAPVNDLFNSLWSNVELYMNDRLISHSNNTHGYCSMISHLIHDSEESLESERSTRLIYKDSPNQMEVTEARLINKDGLIPGYDMVVTTEQREVDGNEVDVDVYNALDTEEVVGNNGLYHRFMLSKNSQMVEMLGRLRIDMFEQERYLPSAINMKLRFHRQKDRFCLMTAAGENFKIQIEEAYLLVRKVRPSPGVLLGHADALMKTTAKFPITRKECKTIAVAAGMRSVKRDNIFLGQLPKRVVVAMVDSAAMAGDFQKNPYNFKHYNFNHLQLYSDGNPVRSRPLKPDMAQNCYIHCYETLYRGLNKMDGERSSIIKRVDWNKGYALTAFDLTPDMDAGDHHALIKHGNLRLELDFNDELPTTINIIVYAEFDNIIEITSDRQIQFDYV